MDELLQQASTRQPLESDQELQQKLQHAEVALKETEARAETFETWSKTLEGQLQSAQMEVGKRLEEKDDLIRRLRR